MRLSTRFTVVVAVLVPVLVLLAGALVLKLATGDLRTERDHRLVAKAKALKPLAAGLVSLVERNPGRTLRISNSVTRLITASTGGGSDGLYISFPDGSAFTNPPLPDAASLPQTRTGLGTLTASDGSQWRYVAVDLGKSARFWVTERQSALSSPLSLLRQRVLLATLLALLLSVAAGSALARVAVRPLTRLREQAQHIDTTPNVRQRLDTESGVVEIDELAHLLNQLLDRRDSAVAETGAALESARAFAATAAHELRTPLTSMGANLSLLGHPDLTPAQLDELIADLTSEHARMQGLITVLRQLAQGELTDPSTFRPVDLADLADAAAEAANRRHPTAAIELSLQDEAVVLGWSEGLRMIVDNLLDNAAIHGRSPDGKAHITMTVAQVSGQAVLAVEDHGPGIPPDQHTAVFNRFHRRRGSPGSGLGLTLVQQQAALHQGSVHITPPHSAPQGTRIELRLPLHSPITPTTPPGPAPAPVPPAHSWLTAPAPAHSAREDHFPP
jgi:two-component system sensor histidine kinase PrrB